LLLALFRLGFGAGTILGVKEVAELLPHFFTRISIRNTIPSSPIVLDKATFGVGVPYAVDEDGHDERLVRLGASI